MSVGEHWFEGVRRSEQVSVKDSDGRGGAVKHFSIAEWVDFVRGVAGEEQSARQQEHLDAGCGLCLNTVETWKSVAEFAKEEVSYNPPNRAVNIAKSYFAPYRSALSQAAGFRIALLAFDSFRGGIRQGIRGSHAASRQLMYTCGDVVVDVRLEPNLSSNRMALVGQVADPGQVEKIEPGTEVSLLREGETIMSTSTSEFGEFYLSFGVLENLQLQIALKESTVVVPLPDFDLEDEGVM